MKDQAYTSAMEFREALRRGRGRAAVLLQKDPRNPELNEELLRGCVENLVYDPQCEAIRAPYLCELIRISGQQDTYREALEHRLRAATSGDSVRDIEQVFGILARLAGQSGKGDAVLREFVLEAGPAALAREVVPDLVRLQGLGAFLACVRRFDPDEDWWLIGDMTRALEKRDGIALARSALREAREADAELDRRIRSAEAEARAPHAQDTLWTYDALKGEVSVRRHFPHTWIMSASEADLERAAEDLLTETSDERLLAYLRTFRRRRFPGDPTCLFPLLGSDNRRVAFSAASVLANIRLPEIRECAHRLIADGQLELGVDLLRSSYGDGDVALFVTLLQRVTDEDQYHGIGSRALTVIEHMDERPQEATTLLLHLYVNGLCSHCRQRAVTQLALLNSVPDWMAEEGCYDADPGIAARFTPQQPNS